MDSYYWQNDAYRDNAKRNNERGGSTVRVFATSAALHRWQGGGIPTTEELAEWSDRYERDVESENRAIEEHWHSMGMTRDRNENGPDVGASGPVTALPARRGIKAPRKPAMTPEQYRNICRGLGITPSQSAEFLGVTVRHVMRWLAGTTPIPDLPARVMRLLRAGAISLDDLRDA